MNCPKCGLALPDDSEFCQYCGSKLAGASVPAGNAAPASAPELAGKTCPFCKAPFMEGEAVVFCSHCEMPHHLECWKENGGCTTFGCTGNIGRIIGAEQKNAQSAPVATGRPAAPAAPKTIPYPTSGSGFQNAALKQERVAPKPEPPVEQKDVILTENTDRIIQGNIPVLLERSRIQKDADGRLYAVCSFVPLVEKQIQAMQVNVRCYNVWREPVEPADGYQYLDLRTSRDTPFGGEEKISLPDPTTRVVEVVIQRLVFADGTLLKQEQNPETITPPVPLSQILDDELLEEYKSQTFRNARFVPAELGSLWVCTCGAVNRAEEKSCHLCGDSLAVLTGHLDKNRLQQSIDEKKRIQREKEAQEREERELRQREEAAARKDAVYASARAQMVGEKADGYEAAVRSFLTISGWKDSDEQIAFCRRKIEEIKVREEAERLEREQEAARKQAASEAEVAAKRFRRKIAILLAVCIACASIVIMLATVIIPNARRNKAALKEAAEREAAAADPENMLAAEVGETVFFGRYEQDNDLENGSEPIEWLVLAKEGNRLLVVSKYALDRQPYNTAYTSITWETCTLRKWLNSTFLSAAFSEDEQRMIPTVTVSMDKDPYHSASSGSTKDRVFLLSMPEVDRYFSSDEARKCEPTEYAIGQGVYSSSSNSSGSKVTCWWWLRSSAVDSYRAVYVYYDGSVSASGISVNFANDAVRPALWIDLSEINSQEQPQQSSEDSKETSSGSEPTAAVEIDQNKSPYYEELAAAEVGGYISFGHYEQDNDLENGKEAIEWLVLAKEGDRILVISKYALDCQPYNAVLEKVTWETCTLRKWLNDDFLYTAFSEEEQKTSRR